VAYVLLIVADKRKRSINNEDANKIRSRKPITLKFKAQIIKRKDYYSMIWSPVVTAYCDIFTMLICIVSGNKIGDVYSFIRHSSAILECKPEI
jgi:hypothetical protein